MKIPLYVQPPPTPIKSITNKNINSKLIAEGSFYKIYKMRKNTVLRVSKKKVGELGMNEVEILRRIRRHPFINRMKKWWIEEGMMHFEMEECECNLNEVISYKIKTVVDDLIISRRELNYESMETRASSPDINDESMETRIPSNINDESYGSLETRTSSPNINDESLEMRPPPSNISFIADPFSDSITPCSTSVIVTDDSSEDIPSKGIPLTLDTLSVPEWVNVLMYQMSSALSHVHSKGIVHMDIKPENILIKDRKSLLRKMNSGDESSNKHSHPPIIVQQENDIIPSVGKIFDTIPSVDKIVPSVGKILFKLCDFNISKIGEGCFFYDGDKVYMAPEILKNKCCFKSDVYSLGLIYLELVNQRSLPKQGEEYLRLRRNDFEGWKIDEIGRRMLEKNPEMRCSSEEVKEYFQSMLT